MSMSTATAASSNIRVVIANLGDPFAAAVSTAVSTATSLNIPEAHSALVLTLILDRTRFRVVVISVHILAVVVVRLNLVSLEITRVTKVASFNHIVAVAAPRSA